MRFKLALPAHMRRWLCAPLVAATVAAACAAQTPAPRILAQPNNAHMSVLPGSKRPFAQPQYDAGRMPSSTQFTGISLYFSRSAAQQAALNKLLAEQQDPASPLYHHWLTPQQFAAQFGMAQSDIDAVNLWLEQQGFSVDSVSKSRNFIRFSGTVGQVEQAFQTQMHYYNIGGKKLFAPNSALSIPSAFSSVVAHVGNLSNFRPRAQYVPFHPSNPRAAFTSSISGNVYFAPGDIKVAYDMNSLIGAGYDGSGQSITIIGQSAVLLSDIKNFQNAAQVSPTPQTPVTILVPGTGSSTIYAGDEGESDLDLEWSSTMAPGASIYFVYTGNSINSSGIFDSIVFAVDNGIGNVISASYGACEAGNTPSSLSVYESTYQQAAAQGQTIVASSGDQGSTACFISPTTTTPSLATQESLSVNYPASSAWVTAVGGTEITSANDASGNQYFSSQQSTDTITSVLQHIPEVAWNDDNSTNGLSATGGGISTIITQPSWQKSYFTATGQTNPGTSGRLVPDISLYSSPNNPGYLYCTSDQSDCGSGQVGSCTNGFRDSSSSGYLTVAGGTSFAAPIFAAMVAVLNQAAGYTQGQGLVNPTFYTLAANPATYSSVFYDATAGGPSGTAGTGNQCLAGPTYCSSTSGSTTKYPTTTGYDLATGLGSFDFGLLAAAWPASTSTVIGTTTTVTASNPTPNVGANVTFTITVTAESGTAAPTGTVTLVVDGGTSLGGITTTATLTPSGSASTATYTTSFSTSDSHSVVAQYGGDSTFGSSTGAASVTIGGSSGTGSFTMKATDVSVTRGSSGTSTITVTPSGGYTGTVNLTFTTSNNSALANLCYLFGTQNSSGNGTVTITGTSAATTTLLLDTNAADCSGTSTTGGVQPGRGFHRLGGTLRTLASSHPSNPSPLPAGLAFAGLLFAGILARSSKRFRSLAMILLMASIGLGISACGGTSASSLSNPPAGTYTITLSGQDSASASISSTTTFNFTIN